MGTKNEIRDDELTRVSGGDGEDGRPPNAGKTLNVLIASRWLLEPKHFCQLSAEDQAALSAHPTDELWLELFLNQGAAAGNEIIRQAVEVGKGIRDYNS